MSREIARGAVLAEVRKITRAEIDRVEDYEECQRVVAAAEQVMLRGVGERREVPRQRERVRLDRGVIDRDPARMRRHVGAAGADVGKERRHVGEAPSVARMERSGMRDRCSRIAALRASIRATRHSVRTVVCSRR
jgi:hypothetical protein